MLPPNGQHVVGACLRGAHVGGHIIFTLCSLPIFTDGVLSQLKVFFSNSRLFSPTAATRRSCRCRRCTSSSSKWWNREWVHGAIMEFTKKNGERCYQGVLKNEKNLKKLSSYCYQGEFNPVFHQLLGSGLDHTEGIFLPVGQRMGQSGILHCGVQFNRDNCWKKMKHWLFGEFNRGRRNREEENYHNGGKGIGLSREFSLISHKNGGLYSPELMGLQNA